MQDIKNRIAEILAMEDSEPSEPVIVAENDEEYHYQAYYTDIYVAVKNGDDFYGIGSADKANMLMHSFLTETLVFLKENVDVLFIESGIDYVKATVSTPDPEVAGYAFEDTVYVNTMAAIYNEALAEEGYPQMEIGIGVALFEDESEEDHEEHSCHCHDEEECDCEEDCECDDACECCEGEDCECDDECDCDDEEECHCGCGHDHDDNDMLDYPLDYENTAYNLADYANTGDLDPIVVNEMFFEFITELDEALPFLKQNLQRASLEELDMTVYHGNIVDETLE